MDFENILHKAFDLLKARPLSGGLEVSDAALRFVFWSGTRWEVASVKMPPGVVQGGKLQDKEGFLQALYTLRARVLGEKHAQSKKKINVIVSLSSVQVFTQVFNLPQVKEKSLESAISLNVRMASPTSEDETYAGWQKVGKRPEDMRLEILSVFLERQVVDAFREALTEAAFVPVALESSALSLARAIRKAAVGVDANRPLLAIDVNSSGIDVIVLRHGHLHFDYFRPWSEIQGENSNISAEQFEQAIVQNVQQVLNFYNSHWPEPLAGVLVVTGNMQERIVELVKKSFQLPTATLSLNTTPPLSPEWFIALGGGFRAEMPRREDTEASLLGIKAQEEFRRQQAISFSEFWRALVPVSMFGLLLLLGAGDVFLHRIETITQQRVKETEGVELATAEDVFQEVDEFNRLVSYIKTANNTYPPQSPMLDAVLDISDKNGVTINSLNLPENAGEEVSLSGAATTQNRVVALKDAMREDDRFNEVDLPLTAIRESENGYVFSMTFSITDLSAE